MKNIVWTLDSHSIVLLQVFKQKLQEQCKHFFFIFQTSKIKLETVTVTICFGKMDTLRTIVPLVPLPLHTNNNPLRTLCNMVLTDFENGWGNSQVLLCYLLLPLPPYTLHASPLPGWTDGVGCPAWLLDSRLTITLYSSDVDFFRRYHLGWYGHFPTPQTFSRLRGY
jgi:hypothetical protein